MSLAHFDRLSYWYPEAGEPALRALSGDLEPGLTLVLGPSGSGKSSFLRLFNGLVPHFYGGRLAGTGLVLGFDIARTPTRTLAREVGFVFQDPEKQLVYGTVEREVAFGLENLGVGRVEMVARAGEALDRLGLSQLRHRAIRTLSGGERQRVVLAGVLALRPSLIVLDEPTSQLDRRGSDVIVDACLQLVRDGTSVLVAEHRLERLLPAADWVVLVEAGTVHRQVTPSAAAVRIADPPPVVELGRRLGWEPLPLDCRSARPYLPELGAGGRPERPEQRRSGGDVAWSVHDLEAGPGGRGIVACADLAGRTGEVSVIVGDNGCGKTTFLRTIAGLLRPLSGSVERRPGRVAYLPQDPGSLLHRASIAAEVRWTVERAGSSEPPEQILGEFGLAGLAGRYPRDLSAGERQRAALAAILAGSPAIALLDEPTRGMDGPARRALRRVLGDLRAAGCSIVVATHDVELAAEIGDRVLAIEDGEFRDLGTPAHAMSGDSTYATQIGALYPGGPVTVEDLIACA